LRACVAIIVYMWSGCIILLSCIVDLNKLSAKCAWFVYNAIWWVSCRIVGCNVYSIFIEVTWQSVCSGLSATSLGYTRDSRHIEPKMLRFLCIFGIRDWTLHMLLLRWNTVLGSDVLSTLLVYIHNFCISKLYLSGLLFHAYLNVCFRKTCSCLWFACRVRVEFEKCC